MVGSWTGHVRCSLLFTTAKYQPDLFGPGTGLQYPDPDIYGPWTEHV
jgi:hypothetical protein